MSNIDYYIANLERFPLSGFNVVDIAGGNTKVVAYHELQNYNSIEELLRPYGSVVLLFETKYNVGHYTCLYYDDNKNLYFFDPYGLEPDEELKYESYNHTPYLTNLLSTYDKPINVNRFRYQQFSHDTNTCGRHVGVRLRTKEVFSPEGYQHLLGAKDLRNSPDWYVSALTLLFTLKGRPF